MRDGRWTPAAKLPPFDPLPMSAYAREQDNGDPVLSVQVWDAPGPTVFTVIRYALQAH
jgi:hypothetical protein